MRTPPGTRHATLPIDVMRPWQAFGPPPTSAAQAAQAARRWMRLVLLTLLGAATLAILLGVAARLRAGDASAHRPGVEATS
jgi:hypothetical protein